MDENLNKLKEWFSDINFYSPSQLANEEYLQKESEKRALDLFNAASNKIPAYKDFLLKNKVNTSSIRSISDFTKIPPTTKENYIQKYDIADRCFGGSISSSHLISTSSGTTGKPHLWPRDLQTEIDGAYLHEFILGTSFDIKNKTTLFINGFAMGNWIAGTFTLACCSLVALKGYPLVIMTPGYSLEAVMETIFTCRNKFDQIIISGHTPFLKEIAELIHKEDKLKKLKIYLLGTGQAITENWRIYVKKLINNNDETAVINLYGSADAALMGFESLDSIRVRQNLIKYDHLISDIFSEGRLPSLYSYDPRTIYFESEDNELLLTKYSSCPLIRYNLHDNGGVIHNAKMGGFLKQNNIKVSLSTKLPFVYLYGRENFLVKLYGANIYSEHIQTAFTHHGVQPFITGRYTTEIEEDSNNNQVLVCKLELNQGTEATKILEELLKQTFIDEVKRLNSEYNFILGSMGERVHPQIRLYKNGDPVLFPKGKVKKNA